MTTFLNRQIEILTSVMGETVISALAHPDVIEIMANPDGKVWLDTLNEGKTLTDCQLSASQRLNIIKLVAGINNLVVNEQQPELSCELSYLNSRFQAWLPPIAESATFTIRKKAIKIFSLDYYFEKNCLTADQLHSLKAAVANCLNIIVAGGTGSGKTTFANALLNELTDSQQRIVVLEDLPEIQINNKDCVMLKTSANVNMRDLVKGSLRMRPDRIIIGEVRDGAALELLKAWNTGHPGGISTLHANSANSVISRLEDLILEVSSHVPPRLIAEAIDLVVFMKKTTRSDYVVSEIKCLSERSNQIFM